MTHGSTSRHPRRGSLRLEFWEHNSRRGLDFDDNYEGGILNRAVEEINGYLNDRLSIGVAYLAEMHRRKSSCVFPTDRQVDGWD